MMRFKPGWGEPWTLWPLLPTSTMVLLVGVFGLVWRA